MPGEEAENKSLNESTFPSAGTDFYGQVVRGGAFHFSLNIHTYTFMASLRALLENIISF